MVKLLYVLVIAFLSFCIGIVILGVIGGFLIPFVFNESFHAVSSFLSSQKDFSTLSGVQKAPYSFILGLLASLSTLICILVLFYLWLKSIILFVSEGEYSLKIGGEFGIEFKKIEKVK